MTIADDDGNIWSDSNPSPSLLFFAIVMFLLATLILSLYPSETDLFELKCNDLYGKGNWSEYSADYIDFVAGSNHPIYFKDEHSFTCFKTGTTP